MKKLLTILPVLIFLFNLCHAQLPKTTQPFGEVDTADLRMTDCSFEKGAGAMVLFDKAEVTSTMDSIVMFRHKRIKILNNNGKDEANIRLTYYSYWGFEMLSSVEAQTIRLENNKIIITKVEPKLIYTERIDKYHKAVIFSFPDVKPGCIIEYRYRWATNSPSNFPTWFFQSALPTRYSQIIADIKFKALYNTVHRGNQPYFKDTTEILDGEGGRVGFKRTMAKANVKAMVTEPYVNVGNINIQSVSFHLHSVSTSSGYQEVTDTWDGIALSLYTNDDFGFQLDENLNKQDTLLRNAKAFNTDDKKIAYLFDEVKKNMKWNNTNAWYTDKGVRTAWSKKAGNSAEINLILYNLLKKSGVKAYPMVVSTRDNGAINPSHAGFLEINKTVTFVPIDSTRYYVLDASGKYNTYNEIPIELLNTFGLLIDGAYKGGKYVVNDKMIFLKNHVPAKQIVIINGEIHPDSKVAGEVTLNSYSYISALSKELYDRLGKQKYTEAFCDDDKQLKVTGLSFENLEVDSLPLIQKFNFNQQLSGGNDSYIYFNPNLFTPEKENPFLNEKRLSDIDFSSPVLWKIIAKYKLPAGYKIDAMPQNGILNMYDKSIIFKRVIGENNGYLEMNYSIANLRSTYKVDEYPALHDFYKKMYDMINEPIVLKKSL